jgi:hypothetical protein
MSENAKRFLFLFLLFFLLFLFLVNITFDMVDYINKVWSSSCTRINPFQSNLFANHILPSSYLFWAGKRLLCTLLVIILQF